MTEQLDQDESAGLRQAFDTHDASTRLQAALAAGTRPSLEFIPVLVAQCGVEPDFYVRDMLTWALVRHDHAAVVERLLPELNSQAPQSRSQALHTLSKIADPGTWPAITTELLLDAHDDVARTAWRAAVRLVPEQDKTALAETLATQFARGDRAVRLSLSRAFADLGPAALSAVEHAMTDDDDEVRTHAIATERIMSDPDEGFESALFEARKIAALHAAPEVAAEDSHDH